MTAKIFFITGTDTEVGKTYVTTHLLTKYKKLNKVAIGLKPIASGSELVDGKLVNEDALLIKKNNCLELEYDEINPFTYEEAIAPHLAAKYTKQELEIDTIINTLSKTIDRYKNKTDYIFIEGAGGFLTPLNFNNIYADVVKKLSSKFDIEIILVVKIKLGCINHSMLTHHYIVKNDFNFHGWIANDFNPNDSVLLDNIKTIEKFLDKPVLFSIPSS